MQSDSFPYPNGSIVGVFSDQGALEEARCGLEQAGFGADRTEILHGEEDMGRIDVEGDEHGKGGGLVRRLQALFSDDADHARRYADELRAGHYLVGVAVGEDQAAKRRAAEALRGAEALDYYAGNYVEDLRARA